LQLHCFRKEMATFLFDKIIFGPVQSRRLGTSLGINLLPENNKVCNFNCIYCECGLTRSAGPGRSDFPERKVIREKLRDRLTEMADKNEPLTTITFAGNGEPTMHPDFAGIIDDTIRLRNAVFPEVDIAVLSNATLINKPEVRNALLRVEQNILKLDSAIPETVKLINRPLTAFSLEQTIDHLKHFKRDMIIQTLFFRGTIRNKVVDNATPVELSAWLKAVLEIDPEMVMIYTIARDTPFDTLHKIGFEELAAIADRVRKAGIQVQIYD